MRTQVQSLLSGHGQSYGLLCPRIDKNAEDRNGIEKTKQGSALVNLEKPNLKTVYGQGSFTSSLV